MRLWAILGFLVLPMAAEAQITVQKPWIRYLLPNLPAAAYMVVHNHGDSPAVLSGAASPSCGMLMLHQSQDDSGMAMMMAVPVITIPAHGILVLAPVGYHLMCMAPVMKIGTKVKLTLNFKDSGAVVLSVPVYGPAGPP
jgi:copper(I)-binding protein